MIGYENQLYVLPRMDFVTLDNEHSAQNFDPYSNRHSPIIGCFVATEQDNKTECSDVGLSDNQIFMTRLDDNLNNIIHFGNNLDLSGLECYSEFDRCGCYNLAFSQNVEAYEMTKKIEISSKTDKLIRKMSKMGETYDDVIQRGFIHLDSDSEFHNEK